MEFHQVPCEEGWHRVQALCTANGAEGIDEGYREVAGGIASMHYVLVLPAQTGYPIRRCSDDTQQFQYERQQQGRQHAASLMLFWMSRFS